MRCVRLLLFFGVIILMGCKDDEDVNIGLTGREESFALFNVDEQEIEGTAFFKEKEDGSTQVTLLLKNTTAGQGYPAHIHLNSASEGGDVVISLNPVEGDNGESQTMVFETDAGDAISYEDLINFDGYVDVHQSTSNEQLIVAQGDIGPNALTGEAEFYPIFNTANDDVSILSFKERSDGSTLVELNYIGASPEGKEVVIKTGTLAMADDEVVISLSNLGSTGMSNTEISQLNDGSNISYDGLIGFDGYLEIIDPLTDKVVANGDIGANKFTGESIAYQIDEFNASQIHGLLTLYERADATFLAVVELGGAIANSHPITINEGNATTNGNIAITLNNATKGLSLTEVDEFNNDEMTSFESIKSYDGHVNVHLSDAAIGTYVARGNIGIN